MDDTVPFGSSDYFIFLAVLVFSRAMDFLSTWVATPNLVLEGNPIAKKLGWTGSLLINGVLIVVLAMWPLSAIVIATASLLVAARNFQSAWLMHSLGEEVYRAWHTQRVQETRVTLYLFCLAGNTLLTAGVGVALIYFSQTNADQWQMVPFAIGMGIIAYAIAVAFYSLLALWRLHRAVKREARRLAEQKSSIDSRVLLVESYSRPPDQID